MKRGWIVVLGLGSSACPPPLPEIPTGNEPFELEAERRPLQGTFLGDRWFLVQGFATPVGEGYEIVLSPAPVTVCDDFVSTPGVLVADIDAPGEFPWGEGGSVAIFTEEGNVSTSGGGIDVDLDVTSTKLVGSLIFDFDENTEINGQFEVPICF
jgi:hypothetical protein